jgi:hypothetical protein
MTGPSQLERRYRRVLACYPKAFRRESEEEILAVLLSTAGEGQRRAGVAESADLIMGALRMHFGMSRSPRPVRNAVRLICLGAVLNLAVLVTILVTLGSVRSAAVHDVDFTGGRWHAVMLTLIVPVLASAPIGAGLWLWLAWANGRGCGWARPAFTALVGLLTIGLLFGLAEGGVGRAALVLMPDVIATTVLLLVGLAAMLLIFSQTASPYYQQEPAPQ